LIDEEVTAIVLALIVVGGIFAVSSTILGERVSEPFSEIAVLGPEMKIGNYPNSLQVNKTLNLYLYVANYEAQTTYYIVYVKLASSSTIVNATQPANAPIISSYEIILPREQNTTLPIKLTIGKPMTDVKLIFEMWTLEKEGVQYSGKWNQLWLNITAPA
jgi:uncharacterized membrane protein